MVHRESQETKDFITNWIHPNFFFSKQDVWHRFGMLGVFGDFVLSCTQGEILEIGVGESSIYLGYLSRKWHRQIYHCDIAPGKILNPLTVDGYLTAQALNLVDEQKAPSVLHIDNARFFMVPSDEMFKTSILPLALSFIDGDHNYEQVKKDFDNVMALTVDNGYVILHDTMPPIEEYTNENRCGTVYRLRQEIEKDPRYDIITLPVGCAISVGLSIVRKKPQNRPYYNE